MAGQDGTPSGLSLPGSPLDLGNFFCDFTHPHERSPAMVGDPCVGASAIQGDANVDASTFRVGDELGAEVCVSVEGGLPILKKEPQSEADMCDEDRDGNSTGLEDQQHPPTGDVVVLPGDADGQEGKLHSVMLTFNQLSAFVRARVLCSVRRTRRCSLVPAHSKHLHCLLSPFPVCE